MQISMFGRFRTLLPLWQRGSTIGVILAPHYQRNTCVSVSDLAGLALVGDTY